MPVWDGMSPCSRLKTGPTPCWRDDRLHEAILTNNLHHIVNNYSALRNGGKRKLKFRIIYDVENFM